MIEKVIEYVSMFIALMVVLPLHEFAHGYAAVKNGDITPKLYNRYTINPMAHFDVIGLICFALIGFGWAKPMPVNPNNFTNYKKGCFWVSVAGVLANFITSFIAYPLFILALRYIPTFGYFSDVMVLSLFYIYWFGLVFFVFNLLPVYPLDGFRVVDVFSKKQSKLYSFLRNKGIFVLYGLFFLSVLSDILNNPSIDILGQFISILSGYLSVPITFFWRFIS